MKNTNNFEVCWEIKFFQPFPLIAQLVDWARVNPSFFHLMVVILNIVLIWFTLTSLVCLLLSLVLIINTLSCLLMIMVNIFGFNFFDLNLRRYLSFNNLLPILKINFFSSIKVLLFDSEGEYISHHSHTFLQTEDIVSQYSSLYTLIKCCCWT